MNEKFTDWFGLTIGWLNVVGVVALILLGVVWVAVWVVGQII